MLWLRYLWFLFFLFKVINTIHVHYMCVHHNFILKHKIFNNAIVLLESPENICESGFIIFFIHFSSPELRAQVSFPDRLLSVCLLTFHIFFSRTTGTIITKLSSKHFGFNGFQIFQMKGCTFLLGEMIENWQHLKIFSRITWIISTTFSTRGLN